MHSIGQYEILDLIGDGGMGAVYRARDPRFDRLVAVKLLHPQFQRDPGVVERFKSEAIIQAKLSHPNIVMVLDFVADETTLAMVMEYIDGVPLSQLIETSRGPMRVDLVVRIMDQVLSAMAFAHARGLVHRDIKPSNILVQTLHNDEYAKVMDFGIAKILGSEKLRTATGAKMGTLAYMSPEHVRSPKNVDARSDIYSLGVVLYEMLTGRVPFDADSEYALMRQIVEAPIDTAGTMNDVPYELRAVVTRALEKDPVARYQSCEEMRAALSQKAASSGVIALVGSSPEARLAPIGAPREKQPFEKDVTTPKTAKRSGLAIGIVGIMFLAVALVIAGIAVIVAMGGRADRERVRAESARIMAEQEHSRAEEDRRQLQAEKEKLTAQASKRDQRLRAEEETRRLTVPTTTPRPEAMVAQKTSTIVLPTFEPIPQPTTAPIKVAGGRVRVNPKDGLTYVWIPPGSFEMGCVQSDSNCDYDEKPRHTVTLSRGFWMSQTEVTVEAYRRLRGSIPNGQEGEDHPVVNVPWTDANAYCSAVRGRLPTEAEWEYAARGGQDGLVYPWGNTPMHDSANYSGTDGRDQWNGTSPVGSFPANGYGIFDMAGNVWEYCSDSYDSDYFESSPSLDPKNASSDYSRVLRGGSWDNKPTGIRASSRYTIRPSLRGDDTGFRCVRDIAP